MKKHLLTYLFILATSVGFTGQKTDHEQIAITGDLLQEDSSTPYEYDEYLPDTGGGPEDFRGMWEDYSGDNEEDEDDVEKGIQHAERFLEFLN